MKIKVWDKIEKKLCAVNSIEFIDSEDRPGVNCFIGDSFTWIKWIESKDAELFLFTGLYDANYNELYDGDCIKFRYVDRQEPTGYGECGGVISFEQGCFVVREIGFDYEAKGETPDILKNWLKDNSCLKTGHNNRRVVMTIQEGELIECRKCGNDFQWVPRNSTIKPKICPRCQKLKDFEKKREYNKKMLSRSNLMDYKRKSDPNPGKYTPKNKSGLKRTKKRNKSEKAKARDNADLWFSRYIRCKYHYQILVD